MNKNNRILYDFESLVDLSLSYIKYLQITNINNFNKKYNHDLNYFKFLRIFGVHKGNFLDQFNIIINEDIYNNPQYPVFTGMLTYYKECDYNGRDIFDQVILCKNEEQKSIILKELPNSNILLNDGHKVKTSNFTRIILGNINDIMKFKNPITVNFMILDYRSNFDKDDNCPPPNIGMIYGDINSFTIAKAYPEIKDPVG